MRRYQCEGCGHETESDVEQKMYIDCPECGKRSGAKYMDNPYGDGQNIMKFDHKNGTNTYSQIRFRPRGIG
jgi:predicted  nucleic acid-binding Zn-ribbon protein